jgi:electron transfer flavoprotein beta subunit
MSIRIAALVSAGKHPTSGQARHCRNDSLALQIGLSLTSNIKVLHAGDANNPALQDYLALGAKQIEVVAADNVVENLAAQLKNVDLILTGTRAENGQDSGLLPYLLAAELKLPIVASALEISPSAGELEVLQFLPKGARRRVKVKLPAVLVVHPLAAATLHYSHAQQNLGRINTLQASNSNNAADITQWRTEAARKPVKLVAKTVQTGHERLMDAISSKVKGGAVVNEGNSVEKAQVILNYLREHRLIDF